MTVRGNQLLSRVNDLIDPVTGEWDEQLIRDNFWHIDAKRILQIPLHHQVTEDYVAWHLTKTGIFSVRSAYYKEWEDTYNDSTSLSRHGGSRPHPVWRKIWSLRFPRKIKIFLWRCLHNAIPCFCVLADRHIGSISQCPICKSGAEDIKHALFNCMRAKAVWAALGIERVIHDASLVDRSGSGVLEFLLCDQSTQHNYDDSIELPELIATASWFVWWHHRQQVRGEEVQTPLRSALAIHALALNFT